MAHARQAIREQVGTTLTGLSTTGSNVFQSRVYPLQDSNLPALLIYTKEETSEAIVMGSNRVIERELTLAVEAYVKTNTNSDDTIDTIAEEIETAIGADSTLNNKAKDVFLVATDINYVGEGENPVAVATLNFLVSYCTDETNPSQLR
jgi:hypothetical protein|tara:strand:- start:285 stop:728 length:444 start_codon:yes stop_codon:yes gene_type:complete